MNDHIQEWIEAYHDGELHGARLQQVAAHLEGCAVCRAELEKLESLSALLQAAPAMTPRASPSKFAAQVNLRLPREAQQTSWLSAAHRQALKTAWQLAPIGLVVAWAFFQAVLVATNLVLRANLDSYLTPGANTPTYLWQSLGYLVSLPGERLLDYIFVFPNLGVTIALPTMAYLQIAVTLLFALLLWSWLASWWTYHRHQQLTL